MKEAHILNGDALKEQFPTDKITGDIIIMRECLVDGEVSGSAIESFFETRASSMKKMYGTSAEEYYLKAVPEINRILELSEEVVNLWFEDDLFCQVNFWFVCSLLTGKKGVQVNLIRPESDIQYGFAGLDQAGLLKAYEDRTEISSQQQDVFSELWTAYQQNDMDTLKVSGRKLQTDFPFIEAAIQAQLDRVPRDGAPGRPEKALMSLIEELGPDFGPVFMAFSKQEAIYGFGDLQVKRLFDQLI